MPRCPPPRQLLLNDAPQPQRLAFVARRGCTSSCTRCTRAFAWPPCRRSRCPRRLRCPRRSLADMLTKWVIRPADRAGVCRDDEVKPTAGATRRAWRSRSSRPMCVRSSSGCSALLHELRALPPSLQLPPGTWQHSPRAAAPVDDADAPVAVGAVTTAAAAAPPDASEAAACAVAAASSARLCSWGRARRCRPSTATSRRFCRQCDGGVDGGGGGAPLVRALLDVGEGSRASLRRHWPPVRGGGARAAAGVDLAHPRRPPPRPRPAAGGAERSRLRPLVVIGPHARASGSATPPRCTRRSRAASSTARRRRLTAVNGALRRLGAEWLRVAPVEHCSDAWAVGMQHTEGWGLVYRATRGRATRWSSRPRAPPGVPALRPRGDLRRLGGDGARGADEAPLDDR